MSARVIFLMCVCAVAGFAAPVPAQEIKPFKISVEESTLASAGMDDAVRLWELVSEK